MRRRAPHALQCGPLTYFVQSVEGCPDLERFVQHVPSRIPLIWLDSARQHSVTGRWSLLGYDPWLRLSAQGSSIELRTGTATCAWQAHPLDALRQVLRRYRAPARHRRADSADAAWDGASRLVGLMGFLSYDLNRWIERLPAPQICVGPSVPELLWYGMRQGVAVDHLLQRTWLVSLVDPHRAARQARAEALEHLARAEEWMQESADATPADESLDLGSAEPRVRLEATSTQAAFETMVARALEHIRAGDIFQANISQQFTAPWRGSALALYRTLRRLNPSPFACFLRADDLAVVSCSPERLVRVQDGAIDARPIAGTRPRGTTPAEDAVNSLDLLLSEKERAEHIMLVDLARNDLGRVCATGSVKVDELMALEDYSHVIHIVSNVAGTLRRGLDAVDVIRAVFPGGTITGCPKVRCMEILRALEPVARGLYTGSLGYLGFDGTMDLNIAIRTMVIQGDQLSFHVGAGIVADSDPQREYQETLAKAGALMEALQHPEPRSLNPERMVHASAR